MAKKLFIAEKPSVARQFADAMKQNMTKQDGYLESDKVIITWCVGHLVTMSYPEVYDEKYRRWSFDTIPFIPAEFKYEVIPSAAKQFKIVSSLLNRDDVDTIYVCTDSGREGEYIYRLVDRMSNSPQKEKKRVWIDSQTEEEIMRGIKEAKDLSAYDTLSDAAYLRAKEDYLMGINFSRALTLKYGYRLKDILGREKASISVGRVMTCVLGMIVTREREIRAFEKVPFYRVLGSFSKDGKTVTGEWRVNEKSKYFNSPALYSEKGFKKEEAAQELINYLLDESKALVVSSEKKTEKKNPPLLYNLAELQNECSKFFKISPDETLKVVQELYEKKMVTYPRTDARVLSTAVSKEITKNISGLQNFSPVKEYAKEILAEGKYKGLEKTRYVDDKKITDHYAIIPTGQGLNAFNSLPDLHKKVYELIAKRLISIFYPAAEYTKFAICLKVKEELFWANFKILSKQGYLKVVEYSFKKKDTQDNKDNSEKESEESEEIFDENFFEIIKGIKKGDYLDVQKYEIKEGETSPPKRYNSGSIILAMENAGQLIEDEELRAQIKGSGIGTSATRAEILKKLITIDYLSLNNKTQILTPTLMGEAVYEVVLASIKSLLNPSLTASWEKGLTGVADGNITSNEYMSKLSDFVSGKTNQVKSSDYTYQIQNNVNYVKQFYK